jgi:hypothetical protein
VADLEWNSFFLAEEPSQASRSDGAMKVALSIFDSPEEAAKKAPTPAAPVSIFDAPTSIFDSPAEVSEAPSAQQEPDGGKWQEFLDLFYEGGKKKVKNPNPDTKDKYPEVQVSTALKDQSFAGKIRKEYEAWLAQEGQKAPAEAPAEEAVEKKPEQPKPKKPKPAAGTKIDSLEDVVPGIYIENQWGTVGRVTSLLPDGGFRYRQYDKIANKWKGTQKIDKETAEKYFSSQSFTVVDDPASLVPEGSEPTLLKDLTPGDVVYLDGKPKVVFSVEEDGGDVYFKDGTQASLKSLESPGIGDYVYSKGGKYYSPGDKVYYAGQEYEVVDETPDPPLLDVTIKNDDEQLEVPFHMLTDVAPKGDTPSKIKEKIDVGDVVEKSSQLDEGDFIESDVDEDDLYVGKVVEVLSDGVMVQDYDSKSGKLTGKPWLLEESEVADGKTKKIKAPKVKKSLTGKEIKDLKTLKPGDVVRTHRYKDGQLTTSIVVGPEEGKGILLQMVNPKTGKTTGSKFVPFDEWDDMYQISRLPKSKIPNKVKSPAEYLAKIWKDEPAAEKEIEKAKEELEEAPAEAEEKVEEESKGKKIKVDPDKWKLKKEQVSWSDIKPGDMVHTKDYGPQRVVDTTSTGVRLDSGVVLTKGKLEKSKNLYTVSRGDKPQKEKAPEPPERPKGNPVKTPDQVKDGDVIEYEHKGVTYRGQVVSWDEPGVKFRVRIIYPPQYVEKYESYDEASGEKKYKTPSFDQAKIDKRKPRILTKDEMKAYDAKSKEYVKRLQEIDQKYSDDVAEYEAAMAGKKETTSGALKNIKAPSSWKTGSTIARDADRFFDQYKEFIGPKVKTIVDQMKPTKSYWHGVPAQWSEMTEGEKKLASSGHLAASEFKKLLTPDEWSAWQGALSSWQGSSGAMSAHKLMGGLENLGIEGGPKSWESANVQHYREEGRKNEALHRAISKAMAYSQLVYDMLGVSHVNLYRGTQTKQTKGAQQGKKIKTNTARELASFSIDPQVGYQFGSGSKRVVKYKVPVERLFVSPVTYASLSSAKPPYSENEYVVAGQDGMEGKVMPNSKYDYDPAKMKLAYERRPLFGPVFDDDVLVIEFTPEDDDWLRSPVKDTWWPGYCRWYDHWEEETMPRTAQILRLARKSPDFRRSLIAALGAHGRRATSIFDSPRSASFSIFDSPEEVSQKNVPAPAKESDASFEEWYAKRYEGGKKKVPNPNPKTNKRYPEVAASTAMKDKAFAAKVYAEYKQSKGQGEQPSQEAPAKEELDPKKPTKPSDLKVGDQIRYTYKDKEMIGKVVSADDEEFRAVVYHPKTGKKLRTKPVSFDVDKMKDRKVERADDWQRPPPPKAQPAKPEKKEPEKPAKPKVLDIDAGGFKQVGPQTGSNPGGLYEGKDGDRYYVKTPKSEDRGRNEILAAKLYELAGIDMPELSPATRDGKFSVASKIIPGLKEDAKALRSGKVPGVLEGIAVDAWLANWDVVGLTYDNLLVDEKGRGRRVDTGGALRYRAQGTPKGSAFGDEVTELDVFTDPKRKSGSVLGNATPQQIVDSIDRVLEIPEDKIRELVDEWGPKGSDKDDLFDTLMARRESLKKQREKYAKKAKKAHAKSALYRSLIRSAMLETPR